MSPPQSHHASRLACLYFSKPSPRHICFNIHKHSFTDAQRPGVCSQFGQCLPCRSCSINMLNEWLNAWFSMSFLILYGPDSICSGCSLEWGVYSWVQAELKALKCRLNSAQGPAVVFHVEPPSWPRGLPVCTPTSITATPSVLNSCRNPPSLTAAPTPPATPEPPHSRSPAILILRSCWGSR